MEWNHDYSETEVEVEKNAALSSARQKVKSDRAVLENGKPFFTYLFIAIQVILFLIMEAAGGSTNTSVLIKFGAKVNWLILEGEWWRLFTPVRSAYRISASLYEYARLVLYRDQLPRRYMGTYAFYSSIY